MWRVQIIHNEHGFCLGDKLIPTKYLSSAFNQFYNKCSVIATRVVMEKEK